MPIVKSKIVNVQTGESEDVYFTPEEEIIFLEKRAIAETAIFPNAQNALIKKIDSDVDEIISAVIGNRASQYEGAEREALAYKAAGYTGTVPPKVQAWATAKNQTATWAADSQIATSTGWRNAENALYAKRLLLKELARNAANSVALATVQAEWELFVSDIRSQLGV